MISPKHHTLSGKVVADAMRRGINRLAADSTVSSAISILIKYKIGGLLVTDEDQSPVGVVSKTNLVAAYYASLPLDSPLEYMMTSPPLFCTSDDPLERALEQMKEHQIYRIYVKDSESDSVVGALAYPDIVGMLYEFCSRCPKSAFRKDSVSEDIKRSTIGDCMAKDIKDVASNSLMHQVVEELSMHHIGAILVTDESGRGVGVISKTDLILAYNHGVPLDTPATEVMSAPVRSCSKDDMLEKAIRQMIFTDVHRLFVKDSASGEIIGVFSLTDAAMNKSGSCQACVVSRIQIAS
ncbi:MAG: CBS domain-containing protein [Desulfofustis sp.]|nr:CBS domain-containing protein [Desulfofustis sp.]NNF47979.1 CBS domain-containing protein [Desulfofustis sp.]